MKDEQILAHIGTQSDTSSTTMWGRLLVGRVFPKHWRDENDWCQVKRWSHFELCARTWSEDDPDAPIEWLKYCVENDLSVRRLKVEIKSANGEVPDHRPQYVLDAAPCVLDSISETSMKVSFERELVLNKPIPTGTRIIVTAVIEPEQPALPKSDPPTD